jgi:hypothetical protein
MLVSRTKYRNLLVLIGNIHHNDSILGAILIFKHDRLSLVGNTSVLCKM